MLYLFNFKILPKIREKMEISSYQLIKQSIGQLTDQLINLSTNLLIIDQLFDFLTNQEMNH